MPSLAKLLVLVLGVVGAAAVPIEEPAHSLEPRQYDIVYARGSRQQSDLMYSLTMDRKFNCGYDLDQLSFTHGAFIRMPVPTIAAMQPECGRDYWIWPTNTGRPIIALVADTCPVWTNLCQFSGSPAVMGAVRRESLAPAIRVNFRRAG